MEDKINIETIDKLAELSMLSFSDEEKQNFKKEVDGIIDMLNKCGNISVVSPPNERSIKYSDLRADEVKESLDIETTMEGISSCIDSHFAVDKVVEL